MPPPLPPQRPITLPDRLSALEAENKRIAAELKDARAASRKSAEEGKLELQRNISAIALAMNANEGRSQQMAAEIHKVNNRLHGLEIENAKQGGDIAKIGRQTSKLEGWMPVLKLVIQAFTAIAAAYAAASAAAEHHATHPEPTPAVAPAHS